MLKKYKIYGERCSGTNYLENIIEVNFDAMLNKRFGTKHYFGFHDEDLKESEDTLFVCIVRNPVDWFSSLYRCMYDVPFRYKIFRNEEDKMYEFLNDEFTSVNDDYDNDDITDDITSCMNIYTGERYKNVFEMRHLKMKWLIEDLPKKVENYILIRYEDLLNDFVNTIKNIKNKGLDVKSHINFPVNTLIYKKNDKIKYLKKTTVIDAKYILNHPSFEPFYEKKLGYIK